jgi:hypothetical protein
VPDWMFERSQLIDLIRPVPGRPRPASTEARRIEPRTAIHSTQLRHFFDRSPERLLCRINESLASESAKPRLISSGFLMPAALARLWPMRHALQQNRCSWKKSLLPPQKRT